MLLAAQPNSPIRRLVLNDVGPLVPWSALMRLKVSLAGKRICILGNSKLPCAKPAPRWGQLTDEQWRHMAEHSARQLEARLRTADRASHLGPLELSSGTRTSNQTLRESIWSVWDAIRCRCWSCRGRVGRSAARYRPGNADARTDDAGRGVRPRRALAKTADQIDRRDFLLVSA